MLPVDRLAALIRQVDGSHSLGAAALAEALIAHGVTVPAADAAQETVTVTLDGGLRHRVSEVLRDHQYAEFAPADEADRCTDLVFDVLRAVAAGSAAA